MATNGVNIAMLTYDHILKHNLGDSIMAAKIADFIDWTITHEGVDSIFSTNGKARYHRVRLDINLEKEGN